MSSSPFDIHAQSLTDYLNWLNSGATVSGSLSIAGPVPFFTWKGTTYSCNAKLHKQKFLDQGGAVIQDVLTLTLLEDMGTPGPQVFDMVNYFDLNMRIQIVEIASGKYPTLICWNPARGA